MALECGTGTRCGKYTCQDPSDPENGERKSGPHRTRAGRRERGEGGRDSLTGGRRSGKLKAKLITGRLAGTTGVRRGRLGGSPPDFMLAPGIP